ncbi:hypothetical protein SCP_1502720 [Sparassis crispa]|uniref:Uncharacterized protein n=1 Tax=Sparassis crispa TaxID=139825 RepID=A0A401H4C2_9APHY|nr:hypothetical protein SCP_1502720 [Sparassis crispa]GBE89264.1 hypothetical protein SCP_1502720 [Sparassis crispa]
MTDAQSLSSSMPYRSESTTSSATGRTLMGNLGAKLTLHERADGVKDQRDNERNYHCSNHAVGEDVMLVHALGRDDVRGGECSSFCKSYEVPRVVRCALPDDPVLFQYPRSNVHHLVS